MWTIDGNDITLVRGDSFDVTVAITENTGETVVPWTPGENDRVVFRLTNQYESETPALIEKTLNNQTLTLRLAPGDTANMQIRAYDYGIRVWLDGNEDADTIIQGKLTLTKEEG